MHTTEALLVGGRSGVGKSSVGWEVAALLRAADVGHAYIEGDTLDTVHPAPEGDPHRARITERNLAAMWGNYRDLGCRRLVYTNTASVLGSEEWMFVSALRGPRIVRVLLTATDATVEERLTRREQGSELEQQLRRSTFMARHLEEHAADGTLRVATDGRRVTDIAADVVAATGWMSRKSPETISRPGPAN
ncbi:hypothetical protein M4V62_09000 [Streptomyces durmitorensis]|uniref:Uncharacterized protein n=1 Tax=Streptomyces durmitorensis TaxID=319947 RepID=A0ABY4PQQ5_9ACTN|nr:hypothetical protein [Streptomyces durmitorensis]UQT55224.1 hypothetical protein M4V62_09000 [Streptomyces durmitorensis]